MHKQRAGAEPPFLTCNFIFLESVLVSAINLFRSAEKQNTFECLQSISGWRQNSSGWRQNTSGWRQNTSGWRQNSSGWRQNTSGWRQKVSVFLFLPLRLRAFAGDGFFPAKTPSRKEERWIVAPHRQLPVDRQGQTSLVPHEMGHHHRRKRRLGRSRRSYHQRLTMDLCRT